MSDKERKKRKPTASEQAWQQRRAESLAAYNQRKAEREERRAANTDDPERAAAARRAAEMYRSQIPAADNGAAALKALRADVAQLRAEINRLRRSIGNLRGDEDTSPGNGYIEVDTSVAQHPVIRFRADKLPEAGSGGGGAAVEDTTNGCWSIHDYAGGYRWYNPYVMIGANLVVVDNVGTPSSYAGQFVAVRIDGSGQSLVSYQSASALMAATYDPTAVVVPIGKLNSSGSGYDVDLRLVPHAAAFDTYVSLASSSTPSNN